MRQILHAGRLGKVHSQQRHALPEDRRGDAKDLHIDYIDQLVPRLIDKNFGPVLSRVADSRGHYEFVNPVFRVYAKLRRF